RVIRFAIRPSSPDHAHPGTSEDAHGVRVIAAAGAGPVVDVSGPDAGVPRVVGEAGQSGAQAMVAGAAEGDGPGFARRVGDGTNTGFGGQPGLVSEAFTYAAELGKDLRSANAPGPRKAHHDASIVERFDVVLDAAGQQADLLDELRQGAGEAARKLAFGFHFHLRAN